jgi:hypothetical protein
LSKTVRGNKTKARQKLNALSMMQLTIVLLASVTILFAVELEKCLLRR